MTARDNAIEAVLNTGIPVHMGVIDEVIRSIPPDVLARLAVEANALESVGWLGHNEKSLDKDEWWLRYEGEEGDLIDPQPIYRIREEQ